ncbi:MAG: PorT family protein [Muribaculaceae bacterium]|nr:PorT family protein [Muribaculaceae bacterium]
MKTKRIIFSLALFIGIFSAQAQEWRGFLEIHAGISPMKSDIEFHDYTFYDMWNPLSFGLNYTMGVAVLPHLYAGIGIGGYTTMNYDDERGDCDFPSLYFPIFANVRWIPEINRKFKPFADLKIGYQMGVDLADDGVYMGSRGDYDYYTQHRNGVFLQPGVGIRFGRESAFNLGIAYNVCVPQEFVAKDCTKPNFPVVERIKRNKGSIMLTFGADF